MQLTEYKDKTVILSQHPGTEHCRYR